MNEFWRIQSSAGTDGERRTDLYIQDEIAAQRSWLYDAVTPKAFKRALDSAEGTLYVWIDSPGGDAFAGNAIHDMLREYSASGRGRVIAMVSLAASAASVIAMAADEIRISIVGTIMIHEPWSRPSGRASVLRAVADVLDAVRDAQVEAYARRTGQSPEKILQLLQGSNGNGTYMNASQAISLGFADGYMHEDEDEGRPGDGALARTLDSLRVASCIQADRRRLDAMERHYAAAFGGAAADGDGIEGAPGAEIDPSAPHLKAIAGAFLRALAREGDAAGSALMEAVACGVRAGLARWDALQAKQEDGEGEDESTRDDGLEALNAALRATEEMEDE